MNFKCSCLFDLRSSFFPGQAEAQVTTRSPTYLNWNTLRSFYLDLGIISQKRHPKHGIYYYTVFEYFQMMKCQNTKTIFSPFFFFHSSLTTRQIALFSESSFAVSWKLPMAEVNRVSSTRLAGNSKVCKHREKPNIQYPVIMVAPLPNT